MQRTMKTEKKNGLLDDNLIQRIKNPQTRVKAIVSVVFLVLCILMMVYSFVAARNMSVFDIPIVSAFSGSMEMDEEDLRWACIATGMTYSRLIMYRENIIHNGLTQSEYQLVMNYPKTTSECSKDCSVSSISKLLRQGYRIGQIGKAKNSYVEGLYNHPVKRCVEEVSENFKGIQLINIAIICGGLLCVALCVLGGLSTDRGLVDLSLFINAVYNLLLVGVVPLLLTAALHIALHICFTKKAKR